MKFKLLEDEPGIRSEPDKDLAINKGKSYRLARKCKDQYRKGKPYGVRNSKGKFIPHV